MALEPRPLELGVVSPFEPPFEHGPQAQYLRAAWDRKRVNDEHVAGCIAAGGDPARSHRPLQYLHFVGGRGAAKTTTAAIDVVNVATSCPGYRTAWTARTNGEIDEVLLFELAKVCPPDLGLYRVRSSRAARWLEWRGGHITHLVSRNVDNPKKRPALGMNLMGVWHDEAATMFDAAKFQDIDNAVRQPGAPYLFVVSTSTPLLNGYYAYVTGSGGTVIHSSSWDNPHLSKEALDLREQMMDSQTAQGELYGRFVPAHGRVWDTFVEAPWPDGNIWESGFDPDAPWYLAVDLGGAQGAFQIVQYREPLHPITGRRLFQGKVGVIVAELTPNGVALETVTREIVNRFCGGDYRRGPIEVLVGHDVASRGTTGIPAAHHFAELGWSYRTPAGISLDKELQRQVARSLILNSAGERRFCVAAQKDKAGNYIPIEQVYGQRKVRGVLNVMRNDTYPDSSEKGTFRKDKAKAGANALEDDRDAMLYWMICNHPPTWTEKTKRAS